MTIDNHWSIKLNKIMGVAPLNLLQILLVEQQLILPTEKMMPQSLLALGLWFLKDKPLKHMDTHHRTQTFLTAPKFGHVKLLKHGGSPSFMPPFFDKHLVAGIQLLTTWTIIPFGKWLTTMTMVSKSPKYGCSPSKWPFHGS